MRVTFLTHYYPPEVGAPQARISALARLLDSAGDEITVHTGFPSYPEGRVRAPYRNRPLARERLEGVRVVRSAIFPAANRGVRRRLANHAAFAASALASSPSSGPADVVVCETPPLFTAAAGVAYARSKRAPLVLNVADRWPASAIELGMLTEPRAIRAASWLERACYSRAAAIVVPTEGLRRDLDDVAGASGRVVRLGPAVDLRRFTPAPSPGGPGPLRLLYAGTLGLAQGTGLLAEAARIAGPQTVRVTIAGGGAESGELRREAASTENLTLLGLVPHERVPGLYRDADAAVVLLRDRPLFAGALPTKLLEAMAAARPVVLSARGESADLIRDADAGVVVPPEDARALAEAVADLARDPERRARLGQNGRRLVEARFGWEQTAEEWRAALASVAGGTSAPRNPSRW